MHWTGLDCSGLKCTGLEYTGVECTGLDCPCTAPLLPLHCPALHSSRPTAAFSKEHRNELQANASPSRRCSQYPQNTALANALRSQLWVTPEITRAVGLLVKERKK